MDALHLLYVEDRDQVTRLTVTADDVVCVKIQCAMDDLQDLVIETYEHMSNETEPESEEDPVDLRKNLTDLGRHLLP